MPLTRERPAVPMARLLPLPTRADVVDRSLLALAFALILASWLVAYVGVMPPDGGPRHHVHAAGALR